MAGLPSALKPKMLWWIWPSVGLGAVPKPKNCARNRAWLPSRSQGWKGRAQRLSQAAVPLRVCTDRSSRAQPVARGAVRAEKRTVSDCASSLSFRPVLRLEADAATQAASSSTAVKVCIPALSLRAQS